MSMLIAMSFCSWPQKLSYFLMLWAIILSKAALMLWCNFMPWYLLAAQSVLIILCVFDTKLEISMLVKTESCFLKEKKADLKSKIRTKAGPILDLLRIPSLYSKCQKVGFFWQVWVHLQLIFQSTLYHLFTKDSFQDEHEKGVRLGDYSQSSLHVPSKNASHRKRMWSTQAGSSLLRFASRISPAAENRCSTAVEVASAVKYLDG